MPPKKRKYPDSCYDIVQYTEERGANTRTQRVRVEYFPNEERIAEYRRQNDLDRLEAIQERKKEEDRKKRAEERKKKAAVSKKNKKKPAPKRKKPKAGEVEPEEEVIEFLEEEEIQGANKGLQRWEEEERLLKEKEKEMTKKREEEVEEYIDDNDYVMEAEEIEPERSGIIIEEVHEPRLEDYIRRYEENRSRYGPGNNDNGFHEGNRMDVFDQITMENLLEARIHETEEEREDRVPIGESIYQQRRREVIRRQLREERRSNYFITVVSNATLKDYTKEEVELLAAELQERVNRQLILFAPDYIQFLTENDSLDEISRIEFRTKPELQESRGENGQLHTHTIVAVTHDSRIHLDYALINEIIQDVARDMGFTKKKTGGIAALQVQIQRASDSTQNEYDYLDEEGVAYEAGDISTYYDEAERAIKDGSMERSDLRAFRRRKKEVASAQKNVRELRGQKFGF
jgi:hypothetical protein